MEEEDRIIMPKTAYINARVDEQLKTKAEKVLRHVGVNTSDAITMFLRQVVLRRGLPFDVRIPNTVTRRAIAELDAGGGERFKGTTEELFHGVLKKPHARRV
jgi:DNA-damage-inducible protein J